MLPQEEITDTKRNLLPQKEIYCCRKKYLSIVITFVELGRIPSYKKCHKKNFHVTGRNIEV